MREYEKGVLVFDIGSGNFKAGLANEPEPTSAFPTIIGNPKHQNIGGQKRNSFVGNAAQNNRGILKLQYPMEHGVVRDWNAMERLLQYAYDELRVNPEQHAVLFTDVPENSNGEKMFETLFEKFNSPAVYVAHPAVLSLFSSGRVDGVVLESGDGMTLTVPVHEGSLLKHAIFRLDLAGRDLTEYLKKILSERGYSFDTTAEFEIVREIKEKLAYVALDFEQEMTTAIRSNSLAKNFKLPDGQLVTISSERFRCPEVLFQPSIIGHKSGGIHEMLHNSINKCDEAVRMVLRDNIILSGGTAMTPGLVERLEKTTAALDQNVMHINITTPPLRHFSAWVGGSILATLSPVFREMLISRQEYDDHGVAAVYQKCLYGVGLN